MINFQITVRVGNKTFCYNSVNIFISSIDCGTQVAMLIANQAADNDNQVSVEQVRQQLEEEYPLAAVPFDDYVEKSDVLDSAAQPVTVTPARIRRMESRSLRTANGIEVKIPTELLNAESEVEFLHADDGSISLLIKNVIL